MNDNFSTEVMEIILSDDRPVVMTKHRFFAQTLTILGKKMPLVSMVVLHELSVQQFWATQQTIPIEKILELDAVVPFLFGEYVYILTIVGNYLYSEKYSTLTPTLDTYDELLKNYGEMTPSPNLGSRPIREILHVTVKLHKPV